MAQTLFWKENSNMPLLEDHELVTAAQQNPAEFGLLYQKWLTPVYRYCYFRVGNEKDAEDITSQVFIKAYEDLPRFKLNGSFSAWLFTIAHARMVDFYRRGARTTAREAGGDAEEPAAATPDMLTQVMRNSEMDRLFNALNMLPEKEQGLIRLRFVAELSYRDIGQIVHRKEDAVRKSVTRLLDRLKYQLEDYHD